MCKFKLMKGGSRSSKSNKYGLTWLLGLLASSQAGFKFSIACLPQCLVDFQHLDSRICLGTRPSKWVETIGFGFGFNLVGFKLGWVWIQGGAVLKVWGSWPPKILKILKLYIYNYFNIFKV